MLTTDGTANMTNEERDLITRFFARMGGAGQPGAGFTTGSVPATTQPLPPIDRDADGLIAQQFQTYPEARYRITQTAIVQEAALAEAQNRIQRLQWELEQTRHAAQQAQAGGGQSKGFFSSLFGGGGGGAQPGAFRPTMPPPQPQYPPSYQPGMFQRGGGSGFLGSALTTAAGVAGGMVVGNALMGAFSGHEGGGGIFGGGAGGGGSPWDSAGTGVTDPAAGWSGGAGGGADPWSGAGTGAPDQPTFDTGSDPFGGGGGGGGFDTGGSGFDSGGGGFDGGGGGFDNT